MVRTLASPAGWGINGGPTETIALLSTSAAIGNGQNPINGVHCSPISVAISRRRAGPSARFQPAIRPRRCQGSSRRRLSRWPSTAKRATRSRSPMTSTAGIAPSSLAGTVVTVTTPDGSILTATAGSPVANGPTDPWGDAQSFTVTYTITPPGGSWTAADNGTYTVELGGKPIEATDGSTIPVGSVFGTFNVQTVSLALPSTHCCETAGPDSIQVTTR